MAEKNRCPWCLTDPLYIRYHDEEWGVPVWDDRKQFEFLVLESAQAGLSWLTILKRREAYRLAYRNFEPELVASFDDSDIRRLLNDSGIIRNRRKIKASVQNARSFLAIQKEYGSFSEYLWGFVNHKPVINSWVSLEEVPAETELSRKISRDMKGRGFSFIGPVILYAHLQATGLINDHLTTCFRHMAL